MSLTDSAETAGLNEDRLNDVRALIAARGSDVTTREISITTGIPEKQIRDMLVNLLLNEDDDDA